jgi:hypothetical protein
VSGDRIVAIITILAMLILVVPRFMQRGVPTRRILRLALVWAVIFVAATAAVLILS